MTEKTPESVGASAADLLFDQLDEQLHIRRELMAGIQDEVDYGEVLNSEQFKGAPPEVRTRLAEKYGLELPEEEKDKTADASGAQPERGQPAVKPAKESEAGRGAEGAAETAVTFPVDLEAELRKKNPRKIIFTGYRLARGKQGQPKLAETGYYLNRAAGQYEDYRNPPPVRVEFPPAVAERLAEPEVRQAVLEFAGRLRKHLGEGGLNLFFDKRRAKEEGEAEQWNPKWKYAPDPDRPNRYREEHMTIGAEPWDSDKAQDKAQAADVTKVPWNVYQAVEEFRRDNPPNTPLSVLARQNETYADWYGKAIQSKRDQIVTQELAKRGFENLPAAEASAPETGPTKEDAAPRAERPTKPRFAVARRAARALRGQATAAEAIPETAPEQPERPEGGLDTERLAADAQPHIRTALKAMREIWRDDPKKQIKEVIRLTTDRLNEEYSREGLIAKGDSEALTDYAEQMVQLVRQEMANLDFLEANPCLSAERFSLNQEGQLEAGLDQDRLSESLEQRAGDLISQALADFGLSVSEQDRTRLCQTMAKALREHERTDFSVLNKEEGCLRLTDWESFKKMIAAVCRDYAK